MQRLTCTAPQSIDCLTRAFSEGFAGVCARIADQRGGFLLYDEDVGGMLFYCKEEQERPRSLFVIAAILPEAQGTDDALVFIQACWDEVFADPEVGEIVADIPRDNTVCLNYARKRMPGGMLEKEDADMIRMSWSREDWHAVSR